MGPYFILINKNVKCYPSVFLKIIKMQKYDTFPQQRIQSNGLCCLIFIALMMVGMASCNAFFDLRQAVGAIAPNGFPLEGSINDAPFTPIYRTEKAVYADVGDTIKVQLRIQGRADTTFIMPVEAGETWRIEANGDSFTLSK
jgi:hypothetical protein